jgi:hypothetical protein
MTLYENVLEKQALIYLIYGVQYIKIDKNYVIDMTLNIFKLI